MGASLGGTGGLPHPSMFGPHACVAPERAPRLQHQVKAEPFERGQRTRPDTVRAQALVVVHVPMRFKQRDPQALLTEQYCRRTASGPRTHHYNVERVIHYHPRVRVATPAAWHEHYYADERA